MTGSDLVSVIVPVYNAGAYLEQALDSVRAQTYTNLEIICVNDGSTDGSLAVMQRYAAVDSRFRVIDKPNEGYGASMNRGIAEATGEWVAILEPDDWVESGMYADMLAHAQRVQAANPQAAPIDIIETPYWVIRNPDTPQQVKLHCSYRGRVRPSHQPFTVYEARHLLGHHPSIWTALYRRSFLADHDIRFREIPGAGWADNPFLVETLCQAHAIAYLPQPYYCYREETPEKTKAMALNSPTMAVERWLDMADVLDRLGETSPIVWMEQIVRGCTNLSITLRYVDIDETPQLKALVQQMFSRMDPQLLFSCSRISPAMRHLFAQYRGIEEPSPALGKLAYDAHLVHEGLYNVWNKGPKQTLDMLKGFLKR